MSDDDADLIRWEGEGGACAAAARRLPLFAEIARRALEMSADATKRLERSKLQADRVIALVDETIRINRRLAAALAEIATLPRWREDEARGIARRALVVEAEGDHPCP